MTIQGVDESNGQVAGAAPSLTAAREGAAMIVTLQRGARLNAVDRTMRRQLSEVYPKAARDPIVYAVVLRSALSKAFSIGGDIREMLEIATRDPDEAATALFDEMALCWLHECFSKPTVSLIDGLVMGTGVGISLFGTHRVAGKGYRFQMPETTIGYFPDCGLAHVFAAMPNAIGMYLALTGASVGPGDAYHLGLVTHCIDASRFDAIAQHLREADPVDPFLDGWHEQPEPSELLASGPRIARYFDAPSALAIVLQLEAAQGDDETWAKTTAAGLRAKCPLALAISYEAVRRARALDLRETLMQDWRIARRLIVDPNLAVGVRAVLIDKTGNPRWSPARLEDVDPAFVGGFFASDGQDGPVLPSRDEMQAQRV